MIKRVLTLANAMNIVARVFVNDGEHSLHAGYEKWLEGLVLHAPTSHCQHSVNSRPSKVHRFSAIVVHSQK